ncbi:hypothetical protein BASA81_011022 [Batrachochytrium salamandrivorans]|nr:hypothetical protein BASA81_011022 [Batrachochytrium salamandrivorans]
MLGRALEWDNLAAVAASALAWELLRLASLYVFLPSLPVKLSKKDISQLSVSVPAFLHAVVVSLMSLYVVLAYSNPPSLYDYIPLAQTIFCISTGYFAWDICMVFFVMPKLEPMFACHAIICFLSYLLAMYPYLHYYGVCFLLFELSTPFMYVRQTLIMFKQYLPELDLDSYIYKVEVAFALIFAVVRIGFGFPMSYGVWRDVLSTQQPLGHHPFIPYYYVTADSLLCILNVLWMRAMVMRKLRPGKRTAAIASDGSKQD